MKWNIENISEITNHRAKREPNWVSWLLIERTYCGIFEVLLFKAILRLFSALVSKCSVTRKHMTVERNRLTFVTCGPLTVHIWGIILGHPVHSIGINEHLYKFTSVTYCWRQAELQDPWAFCFVFVLVFLS